MFERGLARLSLPCLLLLASAATQSPAGGLANSWQLPPDDIARLATQPMPPSASLSPQGGMLVLTTREAMPDLAVVGRAHLKLAGRRIDPETRGPQLGTEVTQLEIRELDGDRVHRVPIEPGHWHGPIWSADERAFALVRDAAGGGELWLCDPWHAAPKKVDGVHLNQVLGDAVQWLPDQRRLLIKQVVGGAAPKRPAVPAGPSVQDAVRGLRAPVRTYQDLLQDAHDGDLLEHYATSQLAIVNQHAAAALGGDDGAFVMPVGKPAMFDRVDASPDGLFLLVEVVERPFSLIVPLERFPGATLLLGIDGKELRVIDRHRLQDTVPIGGVPKGPRQVQWVPTLEHALCWTEAQDGGDPRVDVPFRDDVFLLVEPEGAPRRWYRTEQRAGRLSFAADGMLVLAGEFDRKTRREKLWRLDLGKPSAEPVLVYERSTQDAYGDPGRPTGQTLRDGRRVLRSQDGALFLSGEGASPQGSRPFLDRWNVQSGEKERLFTSQEGRFETVLGFVGDDTALVRSESPTAAPELVLVTLGEAGDAARRTVFTFEDPAAEWMQRVERRLVHYQREDGVPMNGTLYLPEGYTDGQKLPCLLWAYPREFNSAADAGQVRAAPDRHLRPSGASHLFLLRHGYAVFDNASMPIVGPQLTANDTFVEQVKMNARAAIGALTEQGCIDPARVAVAGHSYGAFMTANLLAHSDLFACGIARSGAYNRTLTPFGFQNEERTYWEAPEIYFAMSPFSHAQQINEPLLMIHGDDDNNSGTFPIQSERLFAAIKGHGGTARLCMLPHESHGYRSRQCVLHCLAEMCAWLDAHCQKKD